MTEFRRVFDKGSFSPSLDPLNKILIAFDFYRDIIDDRHTTVEKERVKLRKVFQSVLSNLREESAFDEGDDLNKGSIEDIIDTESFLGPMPHIFESLNQYINCLLPLFVMEVKQSIQRAKETELSASGEVVTQVSAESKNGYVYLTMDRSVSCADSFIGNSDLMLLFIADEDYPSVQAGNQCLVSRSPSDVHTCHTLAVVDNIQREEIILKVFVQDPDQNTEPELWQRTNSVVNAIARMQCNWNMTRIMNLSSINREYKALMNFDNMSLKNILLASGPSEQSPSPISVISQNDRLEIPSRLSNQLEGMYNEAQLEALYESLKQTGITLIQGPPGTGKTTTIMGILSVILNASANSISKTKYSAPILDKDKMVLDECLRSQRLLNRKVLHSWITDDKFTNWYDEFEGHVEVTEDHENYLKWCNVPNEKITLDDAFIATQPRRVLVCAPSNAAVDEIVKRLIADPTQGGGVLDANGERYSPQIVRVGPNVHPNFVPVSLEYRVNTRMQSLGNTAPGTKQSTRIGIMEESTIVCATLSVAGSRDFEACADFFDTVIVDEASQGVELSTLIPLVYGCRRLILVGDPKQLPATVFSRIAMQLKYDQSLFQRLELCKHKVVMLSIQYRMHPTISKFPSMRFYDNKLHDAGEILKYTQPYFEGWYDIPILKPLVFFHLESQEEKYSSSLLNNTEADFICSFVELIGLMLESLLSSSEVDSQVQKESSTDQVASGTEIGLSIEKNKWFSKIAVITPYAAQVNLIRSKLRTLFKISDGTRCPVDVNTVDGFQGQEKDMVIFSAVRATACKESEDLKYNIGFLSDVRRLNVAMTRARLNLWVVGHGRHLMANPVWGAFWRYTSENDLQFAIDFDKIPKNGYLKRWLVGYFAASPVCLNILQKYIPDFVSRLQKDVREITTPLLDV